MDPQLPATATVLVRLRSVPAVVLVRFNQVWVRELVVARWVRV